MNEFLQVRLVLNATLSKMVDWKTVFIVLAFCLFPNLGGFAGSLISMNAIPEWYEKLDLPDWRPPNWLFAPAWTYLYTTMGLASYLVWRDGDGFRGKARWPLTLYLFQLALNWTWTPVFFGLKNLEAVSYFKNLSVNRFPVIL
jgi:tryptophan-rich sensory protein